MTEENDFEIDDIFKNFNIKKNKKKKKDSKGAGNRGELDLVHTFTARFPDKSFFRVVGSGARVAQVKNLGENKALFTGDLVAPSNFIFTIECKYGYDIELMSTFTDGNKQIDAWIDQSQRQADGIGKLPLLCWRKPHHSWLAFIPKVSFNKVKPKPDYFMSYRHLYVLSLATILSQPNSFWFTGEDCQL